MPVREGRGTRERPAHRAGRVKLWSSEAELTLVCRFAALPQVVQERVGPWRELPRQKRRPIRVWDGYQVLKVQLDLLIDGLLEQPIRAVTDELDALRRLGQKLPNEERPPKLRVVGKGPYLDSPVWWTIDSLQIVEQETITQAGHGRRGECCRATATVVLAEFVDENVTITQDRERAKALRDRTHVWQAGDSVQKLAKQYLGDSRRAAEIKQANPRIRRWSTVTKGTRVKIPPEIQAR